MTESELISSYYEAINAVNGNFEFWLSITIALLLAFHFAGHNFPRFLKYLLLGLYLLTSFLFIGRLGNAGLYANQVVEMLEAAGSTLDVRSAMSGAGMSFLYVPVFFGGIIGSLYYVLYVHAKKDTSKNTSSVGNGQGSVDETKLTSN